MKYTTRCEQIRLIVFQTSKQKFDSFCCNFCALSIISYFLSDSLVELLKVTQIVEPFIGEKK